MAIMNQLRSPLPWVGGKFYSRERIVKAFPAPDDYLTYVEPFCGACNILLEKLPYNHLEVVNDFSGDLVNFWMQCRNYPDELQRQIDTLPYARSLYEQWQESLFDDTQMSEMERAVRWFYVLRSSVGGIMRKSKGNWGYKIKRSDFGDDQANMMHKAASLFPLISNRFSRVQIEHNDFEKIISTYGRSTTFFYCDPPYIDAEFYYTGVPSFAMNDHERLAQALNNTPAKVALSYYPHEALDNWYPVSKWRRITWTTYKHAEKTNGKRQQATELLLCNYPPSTGGLWDSQDDDEVA
jgi:DNA adenine methylase